MHLPFFENAYFLQSVGWGIAHSFWQAGLLWLVFKLFAVSNKEQPALLKYNLGSWLFFSSFAWFIFTIVANYQSLVTNGAPSVSFMQSLVAPVQGLGVALPYLSTLYLLILIIHSFQFVKKLIGNHLIRVKGLTKAPLDFRLFTTNTAIHLGIKRSVKVWMSAHVDVPSVTGFFKPVILLPLALINHLSIKQVESILLHELAHIKRNDYLVNMLQRIVDLVLFFNPFVRLLSKSVSRERENCCDDWVMNYRFNKFEYASALLLLEEQRHLKLSFALAATDNKKNLLERIKRLFATEPQTSLRLNYRIRLGALCFFVFIGIFVALPTIWKSPNTKLTKVISRLPQKTNPSVSAMSVNPENVEKERFISNVLPPVDQEKVDRTARRKKSPRKTVGNLQPKPTEHEYVNALINEELLAPPASADPIATLTSQQDGLDSTKTYIIKIEEQQSGDKASQSYLFEIEDNNGASTIKPLIMLNKVRVAEKRPVAKRSLKVSSKKPRTTS